ncbi:DUF1453 domain-containing protein [Streptomyces montanisoli]|uniref:DUF1453 domain-containing protein n=1 Tax=Streptomyces montanisoli TaxID=2798581 RepID=A0A940MG05_9ACTN|nr:DUF1453 domain-containing protein [Streptomyces montanisoli]MBP0459626.1 DUF1453 domain-containing protein [Streptomyces montanisoli]
MKELLYVLAIVALVVVMVMRQARPRRVGGGGRRSFALPIVMVVLGVREGHLVDSHHAGVSVALLAAELLVGVLMGVGWAITSKVWREPDGSVWSRGTKATTGVWFAGFACRMAIMGLGALVGIHQSYGALLITLGVSFALRSLLLTHRAGTLSSGTLPSGAGASYGGAAAGRARKDRV